MMLKKATKHIPEVFYFFPVMTLLQQILKRYKMCFVVTPLWQRCHHRAKGPRWLLYES